MIAKQSIIASMLKIQTCHCERSEAIWAAKTEIAAAPLRPRNDIITFFDMTKYYNI